MTRVMVGMSGGVDSSVAALLLKEQGYDVVGVFMKNWEEAGDDGACTAAADHEDVRRVAGAIGIPYYTVNFAKRYRERVFSYFLDELARGRTPNPDVLCNSEIKFRAFLDLAVASDADFLATGHFARLERRGGRPTLLRARDGAKDQTYFLCALTEAQLERVLFPVGELTKGEIRRIAAKHGLVNAAKKDSTGICFIGERDFKRFLMDYLPACPGDIVDISGRAVGRHDGLMYYTLGQRRGLGIGGRSDGSGESWFVVAKDMEQNRLIVRQGEGDELYSTSLETERMSFISGAPPSDSFSCTAKFRYRQSDRAVAVEMRGDRCKITFAEPQRAITPGQWAVLYDGDVCLGGGVIASAVPLKPFELPQ